MKNITNLLKNKKVVIAVLVILAGIGLYLRLRQISTTNLWYDEAFTGITVRADWGRMFQIIIDDKVHPPVYYILVKLWTMFFGNTQETLRLFSTFFGITLIPLTYYFMRKLDSAKGHISGLLAAFFVTVSPFFVIYSVEARSYTLWTAAAIITATLFVRALKVAPTKFSKEWVHFLIGLLVMLSIHYFTVFFAVAFLVAYLIIRLLHAKKGHLLMPFFTAAIIIFVALVILAKASGFYDTSMTTSFTWITQTGLEPVIRATYAYIFGVNGHSGGVPPANEFIFPIDPITVGLGIFTLIIVGATYIFMKAKEKNEADDKNNLITLLCVYLIPLCAVALATSFGKKYFIERYFIISGWALIALLSYYFARIQVKVAVVIIVVYVALLFMLKPLPTNSEFSSAAQYLKQNTTSQSQLIYFDSPSDFVTENYYTPEYEGKTFVVNYNPSNYWGGWALVGDKSLKTAKDLKSGSYYVTKGIDVDAPKSVVNRLKLVYTSGELKVYLYR